MGQLSFNYNYDKKHGLTRLEVETVRMAKVPTMKEQGSWKEPIRPFGSTWRLLFPYNKQIRCIEFVQIIVRSDNELRLPEMKEKWGHPLLFRDKTCEKIP